MLHADLANEINHLNTAYLLLAQKLLRQDKFAGMLRLGISPKAAEFVLALSSKNILKMSSTNALLCGFRLGELLPAILESAHDGGQQQAHLFIVLASQRSHPRQETHEETRQ